MLFDTMPTPGHTLRHVRDAFLEFYPPDAAEEARFIRDGTVVVDANVLLDLYHLDASEREQVLTVFSSIAERLWIPYQVGLEYQRNRMKVIRREAGVYEQVLRLPGTRQLQDMQDKLAELQLTHEVSVEVAKLLPDLATRLQEITASYSEAVQQLADTHVVSPTDALRQDPVRDRLDSLFAGRIGQAPTVEQAAQRLKEALRRYDEQIPPGYKDENKPDAVKQAGDYFLWAELLAHAEATKEHARPFLLVTNDTKEDWYQRTAGQAVAPRPELVREFARVSSHGYHQVTLSGLLTLANKHLDTRVDDETIAKTVKLATFELPDSAPTSTRWSAASIRRMQDALEDGRVEFTYRAPEDARYSRLLNEEDARLVFGESPAADGRPVIKFVYDTSPYPYHVVKSWGERAEDARASSSQDSEEHPDSTADGPDAVN